LIPQSVIREADDQVTIQLRSSEGEQVCPADATPSTYDVDLPTDLDTERPILFRLVLSHGRVGLRYEEFVVLPPPGS